MKSKYLGMILAFLLLPGCAAFHEKPLPPSEATDLWMKVVWVDSVADIPRTTSTDVNGAAIYFDIELDHMVRSKRYCTIYMVKPYGLSDFDGLMTLGHEVLHCTEGSFHNPEYSNFGAWAERQDRIR